MWPSALCGAIFQERVGADLITDEAKLVVWSSALGGAIFQERVGADRACLTNRLQDNITIEMKLLFYDKRNKAVNTLTSCELLQNVSARMISLQCSSRHTDSERKRRPHLCSRRRKFFHWHMVLPGTIHYCIRV